MYIVWKQAPGSTTDFNELAARCCECTEQLRKFSETRRKYMYDIIIIGSGPAGLSAAIYAKRANLNVAVVEKEYEGTGQIAESGNVNNYLGLPNINGYDLGEKFMEDDG